MSNENTNKTSKKLDINFVRTCSCPDNKLNCLEPKEWVKSQVAIWEFFYEKRDVRDKDIHPAVFLLGYLRNVLNYLHTKVSLSLIHLQG